MCGIAGFIHFKHHDSEALLRTQAEAMAETLRHRGPDAGGVEVFPACGLALGHRRLSVLDLSTEGRQPMRSACGRYTLIFNGEIYNFESLREELTEYPFRGHSDTEVMLAAFEAWGLAHALERFNGMFAFALWDETERKLHLVRDRLGIKPLYYGRLGEHFFFASELKALRAHPAFTPEVDVNALALYLRTGYVPAPHSIYKGIAKLPPGCHLHVAPGDKTISSAMPYWSVESVVQSAQADKFQGTEEEAVQELDALLKDAVRQRMVADVPIGAFLSGGIDSSTIVALMQSVSNKPIRTFTIGFKEDRFNEAPYAQKVANHLGTDHTELYVTPEEAMAVIPSLGERYCEPFADSSQIPTLLVSELARRDVTVALSGDGGDELFWGYQRYSWGQNIWNATRWCPRALRILLARMAQAMVPRKGWGTKLHRVAELMHGRGNFS